MDNNFTHKDKLHLLRQDDPTVVKQLFYEFYPFLCQVIVRIVKDRALAEDLAQDTFFRFWEKRNSIQVNTSLKAYLRRMAINEALYYIRKNKKFQKDTNVTPAEVSGVTETVESGLLHNELQEKIKNAIQALPPRCQLIFKLSRYEDLTYQQIADKLEISIKTVENQMGKALKLLRAALQPYLQKDSP